MLTRLKVRGFKNLVEVDVRFGPFTCIAGANGVGKSNLFDSIRFLAALADKPLLEAALSVRVEGGRASDVRDLFHCVGDRHGPTMRFEAEMLVPPRAVDDFGQEGTARTTILKYTLELGYREHDPDAAPMTGGIEILSEDLRHIQKGEARSHIAFPHSGQWRAGVVTGESRSPLISTDRTGGQALVKLHQDQTAGRPSQHVAARLPRTVLSSGSASESPTVLCARREMASWLLLQLEPSALRRPSDFTDSNILSADGANLPAVLHYLARTSAAPLDEEAVYCTVANRLSGLLGGVARVRVERDEKRELLTLMLCEINGTELPARSLSDGTLRFLALSVLEQDPRGHGLICLEEPENGIHPERIAAMVGLLRDIAVDPDEPSGDDNPLRQVIANTHSPVVVGEVPEESLLVAELAPAAARGLRYKHARFGCLPDTWRAGATDPPSEVAKGTLLSYLNPSAGAREAPVFGSGPMARSAQDVRRVRDRKEFQMELPLGDGA